MNFLRKKWFLLLLNVSLAVPALTEPAYAVKVADPADTDVMARIMPAPMMVIGTYDAEGRTNFSLLDRGGIAASQPETRIALCMNSSSYTYKNIIAKGALTINLPSEEYAAEADLFGSFSGVTNGGVYQDKLAVTGMTAVRGEIADAPTIKEFPVSMECELVSSESIDDGDESEFKLLIVKVVKVWLDRRYVNESGSVNPKPDGAPEMIFYNPGRGDHYGYYRLGEYLGKPETLRGAYEKNIPPSDGGGCDSASAGFAGFLIIFCGIWKLTAALPKRKRNGD